MRHIEPELRTDIVEVNFWFVPMNLRMPETPDACKMDSWPQK